MANPVVSIIVPVYNTEKYLRECIESIPGWPADYAEIIIVDDGSNTTPAELCDALAAADPRIRVIHKPNGGLSSARNAALDHARGEYITFLDSDDLLHTANFQILLSTALQQGRPDIICGAILPVDNNPAHSNKTQHHSSLHLHEISPEDAVRNILLQHGSIDNSLCGKFFKRNLWQDLRMTEGILYEDLDVFYRVFMQAKTVVYTTAAVYFYRRRPGSIINTFSRKRTDVLDVTDRILQWASAHGEQLTAAARCRRLSAHINILGLMLASNTCWPDVMLRCRKVVRAELLPCANIKGVKNSIKTLAFVRRFAGEKNTERLLRFVFKRRKTAD